ncbi:MAG: 2Fe-2S iron-sulfur cluster binding domain-containing protein [Treponema sp.]|jgi:ferredoxin|nr:2Fe-2S iron-sulfur cluster binding domain-containing protein [Treponema sp.]
MAEYTITVYETGKRFPCRDDQAVLKAMIHAQGPVKHGCCGGGCGVCRMKIVKGRYEAFKPMSEAHVSEADRKAGIILVCCIQPRGDLVVARV